MATLPPIPQQAPMTNKDGTASPIWARFYQQVLTAIGAIPGVYPLSILNGGTGQSSQQAAINALAGSGSAGEYLRNGGTNWTPSTLLGSDVSGNIAGNAAGFTGSLSGDATGTQSATVVAKVNGASVPASKTIVGTNSSGQIVDASVSLLGNDTTGVSANVTGLVAIVNGGTGQTTANAALNNLLPSQTGKSGDFLTTDGTNASWGASGGVPAGSVVAFAGTAAPTGWLSCDGSAVSRTTYSALFNAISTTYGSGDGSTTFNLPNSQGVFLRGAGSQTVGGISHSGTQGTTQGDQIQGHYHSITDPAHGHGVMGDASGADSVVGIDAGAASDNGGYTNGSNGQPLIAHNTTGLTVSTPSSDGTNGTPRTGSETRPANISVLYIIKT